MLLEIRSAQETRTWRNLTPRPDKAAKPYLFRRLNIQHNKYGMGISLFHVSSK